jgi:hypothetical protein
MRVALQPHPDSLAPSVRIEVEASRQGPGRLDLQFVVTGEVDAILFPPHGPVGRADRLWLHTCFEAFVRAPAEAGYFELNFAPSGQWAVYRFSDYRAGMAQADEVPAPEIEARKQTEHYELRASVDLEPALGLLTGLPWQIGLSAVIERRWGGAKSYWAAAHPAGEPDFHHRDCFALELPPPKDG